MRFAVCALVLLAFLAFVYGQETRVDFTLEYTGILSMKNSTFSLKSTSQDIQTLINPQGDIHYHVINRFIGPVSLMNGTLSWVTQGKTFRSTFWLSFGADHITQPHVVQMTSLDMGYILPSHHDIMELSGVYNVTAGLGGFSGATGGVSVIGTNAIGGDATWLVTGIFWLPAT